MALDIYYPEDVARTLAALDVSSAGTVAIVDELVTEAARTRVPIDEAQLSARIRLYRRGYQDALAAVALAFGVLPRNWTVTDQPDRFLAMAQLPPPPWDG